MKTRTLALIIVAVGFLASCVPAKEILYFQDIDNKNLGDLPKNYEAIIKKDDKLTIVVSGPDKTVTAPYNLTLGELSGGGSNNAENSTIPYLVDPNGNIDFPILGTIHVEGMTRNQLVQYLTDEIGKDVKNPIVSVSFKNYKITVLGEVRSPGTYVIDSEKCNILQALGRAGDLTLAGSRSDLILLREVNGHLTHTRIDLRSSDILQSPNFYMQQNDILVVSPTPVRVMTGTSAFSVWSFVFSSLTTCMALVTFLLRI